MGIGIFGVGLGGLNAAQAGLTTAGHNISNAHTVGFHRQEVVQATNSPYLTNGGYIGQGTRVDTVKRLYSAFLDSQVSDAQTKASSYESYGAQVTQVDNLLADASAGFSPALQDFFSAVNNLAGAPNSVPSRQALLSGSEAMITRVQGLDNRLTEMRDGISSQIRSSVDLINSYAQQIAAMNAQIASTDNYNQPPNDLLDQREQLIADLNKEIKTSVLKQEDGSYNVFIGSGQSLVLGSESMALSAVSASDDPERWDLAWGVGGGTVTLNSDLLQGGTLGGLLAFRSEMLDLAQNSLGRVVIGLAQTFNDQHKLGQDLNGNPGGDFFTVPVPKVIPEQGNSAGLTATVTINDVGKLTTEDYNLRWSGAAWELTTVSSGAAVAMTGSGTAADPFIADGLSIEVAGVPVTSDSFQIQPTRNGARDIALAISDTAKIAMAAPIRTAIALATNTGTGKISAGTVNSFNDKVTITVNALGTAYDVLDNTTGATLASNVAGLPGAISFNGWSATIAGAAANSTFVVDNLNSSVSSGAGTISVTSPMVPNAQLHLPNPNLQNPVTITFTGAATFDVTDAINGVLAVGVAYTAGGNISYNGWNVKISGTPATNDVFTIGPNTNGVTDNRNALLLAGLQTKNTLVGGTATYQGTYSQMVSMVGNKANEVDVNGKAQQNLLTQTTDAQQSMAGVNLDEEAANLMRYQQAYQASAKMIQIAGTLFDTLLGINR